MSSLSSSREWLEADGLGGYASGTASRERTRRFHALLLVARTPPTDRHVLVNDLEVWVESPAGTFALSSHRYAPGVVHPDGRSRLRSFESEPWPRWTFELEDGSRIEHEIFSRHEAPVVALAWRLLEPGSAATLYARPLLSGRSHHALHRENGAFRFEPRVSGESVAWNPYPGVPEIVVTANADYRHEPEWYRGFLYEEERRRGLDAIEDLASPGVFRWDLARRRAVCVLSAAGVPGALPSAPASAAAFFGELRGAEEARRRAFASPLLRAADAYLVRRGCGRSIIAGYPWFTDWGRDTFIALRGLCLATGRLEEAAAILTEWSGAVSEGMLPNRFPDESAEPEYNAVDASLWFIIAVDELLETSEARGSPPTKRRRDAMLGAAEAILDGYARGTRYGIALDDDGLLRAGEPGLQLTWMDAKLDGRVITPRSGKPVEVEALWLNALSIGARRFGRRRDVLARGRAAFLERFWNGERGCLHDVIDCDHRPGAVDSALRPNQVLAAGGLPELLLERERARRIVDVVEERLWTPLGLRTLAPGEPGYAPRYTGDLRSRDEAYHQGTAWPWLLGPFVEAWVRVRGGSASARREARERFVAPLIEHLEEAGVGHVSEIADGDPPHEPRGCPFQAWSMGELLRLQMGVLDVAPAPRAL